jgi:hypothetical protein
MATEKWIAGSGQGLKWGNAFGAEIQSLQNGYAVLSSVTVSNGTPLDIFADVDILAGTTVTTIAPAFLSLYLFPLLRSGSVYGDGSLTTTPALVTPVSTYLVDSVGFPVGTITISGMWRGVIIPPGTFKFALWSQAGVTLDAGVTSQYRTYNRQVS